MKTIIFSVLGITLILHIASLIGLLLIKYWARKVFVVSTFVIFPLVFFTGPNIDHAVGYTFDQLSVLVQGMLFAFLFFSDSYQEIALNKTLKDDTAKNGGAF